MPKKITQKEQPTAKEEGEKTKASARSSKAVQGGKGAKDVASGEQSSSTFVKNIVEVIGADYGFSHAESPATQDAGGEKGEEVLTATVDFTAGISRAYIQQNMANWQQPVKLYTIGLLPGGERKQQHQISFEMFGEKNPAVDAQIILMGAKLLRKCCIASALHINSIGCTTCRGVYKEVLSEYYKNKRAQVCEDCKKRLTKSPMRLLDCTEHGCQPIKEDAPHLVDYLCEECKDHFTKVLEFLDELELPYHLDPFLVRGFDYYNRTVFEFFYLDEKGKKSALGGGGRYDYLVEVLGGKAAPACGFAVKMERLVARMKEIPDNREIKQKLPRRTIRIFFAQLGEQAKRRAMSLYEDLLNEAFPIAENFAKDSLKAQLETANKMNVTFTLILGQKELLDGTIIIRNMEGGEQEVVDVKKIIPILHKKLDTSRNGEE